MSDEREQASPEATESARAATTHLITGTVICLATFLVFIAFWNRLPASVPVQITADGSPGNHLPKAVLVFGFPLVFATLNLAATARMRERLDGHVVVYYVVPALAVVLCAASILMAMS